MIGLGFSRLIDLLYTNWEEGFNTFFQASLKFTELRSKYLNIGLWIVFFSILGSTKFSIDEEYFPFLLILKFSSNRFKEIHLLEFFST